MEQQYNFLVFPVQTKLFYLLHVMYLDSFQCEKHTDRMEIGYFFLFFE
jgi:hypothetical protein